MRLTLIYSIALFPPDLVAVQLISDVTTDINTNGSMVLAENIKWAGDGDLDEYHRTNGKDVSGEICILTNKGATRCFEKSGQKYQFSRGFPVTETVYCTDTICKVEPRSREVAIIKKEKWTNISDEDTIYLMSKFIPDTLTYAKSVPFIGKALSIPGPGKFRILFKSIRYLLEGTFTANYLNGQVSVLDKTSICIPLKLKDGSTDGIYVIDKS